LTIRGMVNGHAPTDVVTRQARPDILIIILTSFG
jgi:hypothetical protein